MYSVRYFVGDVPLWSYYWACYRTMVGYILSGSSIVIIGVSCELLRLRDINGKVHGLCHINFSCDNERTIALLTNALRAYEENSSELSRRSRGRASRYHSIEMSKFCLLPKTWPMCFSEAGKHCLACWCETPAERNGRPYSIRRSTCAGH